MARLRRGDEDLAAVEVAGAMGERTRGLLGRDGVVLRTCRLPRNRLTRVVWRARTVLEAEAGAFTRWGLAVGDRLAVATAPPAP